MYLRQLLVTTTILLLLFFTPSVLAISIAEYSFDELYDKAEQIVLASVQGSLLYEDEDEFVNANITLYIEDVYKGDITAGEVIVVSQHLGYGGPRNYRGDMVIVFLVESSRDTDYYVLNSHQGLWRISKDGELGGMISFNTMAELEEALLQKGWQPDQGYLDRTSYEGQLVVDMKEYEYIKKETTQKNNRAVLYYVALVILVLAATSFYLIKKKKAGYTEGQE